MTQPTITIADLLLQFTALDVAARDACSANVRTLAARCARLEAQVSQFGTMLHGFAMLHPVAPAPVAPIAQEIADIEAIEDGIAAQADRARVIFAQARAVRAQARAATRDETVTWGPDFDRAAGNMAAQHATTWGAALAQAGIGTATATVEAPTVTVEAPVSQYVGVVGQRGTFEQLTLRNLFGFRSDYAPNGRGHGYQFEDEDGNAIVAMVTRALPVVLGTTYAIRATIKSHRLWEGQRQTLINRCEVVAG